MKIFKIGDKVRSKLQGEISQHGDTVILPHRIGYVRKVNTGYNNGKPCAYLDVYWINAFDYKGYIGGLFTRDCLADDIDKI